MRKKYQRYDFKILTSDKEIIILIPNEKDELRIKW